jgi:hypothetical protein
LEKGAKVSAAITKAETLPFQMLSPQLIEFLAQSSPL